MNAQALCGEMNMNERDIFIAAVRIENVESRQEYLDEACGNDGTLRERVEGLLSARDREDSLLDRPPLAPAATIDNALNWEEPEKQLGPYKLREQIGEGGFGVVYVAEQTKPVRRKVALKVIKPGMDSREVVARFEAERQALAIMDHSNIARVFDAGTTKQGRPYFVMELVHGVPITEFCDKNNLPTKERLRLFLDVCRAVQHAHQKGIIHRDLKPNNVMVTLRDGEPIPKVIDFGVSKALSQQLTEKTIYTSYGQVIGTPQYMSPEQAEMSELGIDIRSDIYSLGVLLYELLAGATPVDPERLRSSGYAEMMRIIRDEEPPRPSARVSTMGEQATIIAQSRHTDAKGLSRILSGELDWIVMKSLDKNRDRRYETANHFAADIQRFLGNEAVQACPPSLAYRVSKTIQRHRGVAMVAAALTMMLCLGLVGTSVGLAKANEEAVRAREAERNETAARELAVERATDAETATVLANQRADTINQNLYRAQMGLGGYALMNPGNTARIAQLTDPWLPKDNKADLRGWEWYFLRANLRQDLKTLRVPIQSVNHSRRLITFPRFDRISATGEDKNMMRVWDANAEHQVSSFSCGNGEITHVAWTRDGHQVALIVYEDGEPRIEWWNAKFGQNTRVVADNVADVEELQWSPDGGRIACVGRSGTRIYDVKNGGEKLVVEAGTVSVTWSPDGKQIATCGQKSGVQIWDAENFELVRTLSTDFTRQYWRIAWSPDGKRLAVSRTYVVRILDVSDGTILHSLEGHRSGVSLLAWSPDGEKLATASGDQTIRIWAAKSGRQTRALESHSGSFSDLAWNSEGDRLMSSTRDGTVKLWSLAKDQFIEGRFSSEWKRVTSSWSPNPKLPRIVLADTFNTFEIWDPDGRQMLRKLDLGERSWTRNVSVSPDGKFLTAGRGRLHVYEMETGRLWHTFAAKARIHSVDCSPMGNVVASTDEAGNVDLWDIANKKHLRSIGDANHKSRALAWSHDGKCLAVGRNETKNIEIWDIESGQESILQSGHQLGGYIRAISWSPDGKSIVSSADDMVVWDVKSRQVQFRPQGHTNDVLDVDWHPNGSRIASGARDGVKIWDSETGEEMMTLNGHERAVSSVEWNHDGTCLASSCHGGITRIWDARKGYDERTIELAPAPSAN